MINAQDCPLAFLSPQRHTPSPNNSTSGELSEKTKPVKAFFPKQKPHPIEHSISAIDYENFSQLPVLFIGSSHEKIIHRSDHMGKYSDW